MSLQSALYEGWVRHRRFQPVPHAFRYPIYMAYLDLAELWPEDGGAPQDRILRSLARRIRRSEHFGDPAQRLDDAARAFAAERLNLRDLGPVRMLTHARQAGFRFNPVSFFYCFDAADTRVEAVISEVHNTPWGETHLYVQRPGVAEFEKEFHVSPFMPMDQHYAWRFVEPRDRLVVHMESSEQGTKMLDATLVMRRRPLADYRRVAWRHSFMTHRVIAGIYLHALKLWRKGVRYHAHPVGPSGLEVQP